MAETTQSEITIKQAEPPRLLFALVNLVMNLLLRSPLHGMIDEHIMLLRWQGRKSGKQYTTPVGYKQDGDRLTVYTFSGWKANFREPHPVQVKVRGKWRSGTGELDTDPRHAAEYIKQSVAEADSARGGYQRFQMAIEGEREPTVEELIPEVQKRNMVLLNITLNS